MTNFIFTSPNKNEQNNSETRTSEFLLVSNIILQTLCIKEKRKRNLYFSSADWCLSHMLLPPHLANMEIWHSCFYSKFPFFLQVIFVMSESRNNNLCILEKPNLKKKSKTQFLTHVNLLFPLTWRNYLSHDSSCDDAPPLSQKKQS